MGAMKVLASPQAVQFVQERGGCLFVWADVARCCTGALTFLEASTDSPGSQHEFQRMGGDAFDLLLDVGGRALPREIHVDLKGWVNKRIRAYWNGCAYALD